MEAWVYPAVSFIAELGGSLFNTGKSTKPYAKKALINSPLAEVLSLLNKGNTFVSELIVFKILHKYHKIQLLLIM